jgi:broad specificity phosphatase PhoE
VVDRIVLVRHGETEWSRSGRHTGRTDIPLTARGRHQATEVAAVLPAMAWSRVLTSPLQRAAETCRLAGLGEHAQFDHDLEEWDYGEYEGVTTREILERRPGWWLWTDGCPGGEGPGDVAARADRVLERCRALDGNAILFAHGHLLRVLAARWIGADATLGAHLVLSTAAISMLGWEHAMPVIFRWNGTAHLTHRLGG